MTPNDALDFLARELSVGSLFIRNGQALGLTIPDRAMHQEAIETIRAALVPKPEGDSG